MLYLLHLLNGEVAHATEVTQDCVNVGRDSENDVVFEFQEVSRHHARLNLSAELLRGEEGATAELMDLGSSYGVWVNQEQVYYHPIEVGQAFAISDRISLVLSFWPTEVLFSPAAAAERELAERAAAEAAEKAATEKAAAEAAEKAAAEAAERAAAEAAEKAATEAAELAAAHAALSATRAELAAAHAAHAELNAALSEARAQADAARGALGALTGAAGELLEALAGDLLSARQPLPAGAPLDLTLTRALRALEGAGDLLRAAPAQTLYEAADAWRARVAHLCPAEFTLHLDVPAELAELPVAPGLFAALHLLVTALLSANEEAWLALSFDLRGGALALTATPPSSATPTPATPRTASPSPSSPSPDRA